MVMIAGCRFHRSMIRVFNKGVAVKVFDIHTVGTAHQIHSVVADSMAEAERIFLGKYWPIDITRIELHSQYVQIQKWDEQNRQNKSTTGDWRKILGYYEKFFTYIYRTINACKRSEVRWRTQNGQNVLNATKEVGVTLLINAPAVGILPLTINWVAIWEPKL